ncbi:acyltransferase [Ruminococcus sp. FC2018]|uniref:acyltransferase family protein n=1 Tax=Ruminococcus sp. FC2018 TaxID=1410617 RepID=UPI00048EB75A|nr:acyltransferase [Ruminococcus sp. FC2018]
MVKRLNYIDNLRWMTVSLLIVYHAAIAYNTWDEANYIFFEPVKPIAAVVSFISPWFMPIMFLLAGVSARFSLQKRGYRTFIKERFVRLGIPFVFGLLAVNPIMSYVADVTHNGYSGGYFAHYTTYFTKFTDLTGYDGGFTLGHFWFLGVLIIISILSCVIIRLVGDTDVKGKKGFAVAAVLTVAAIALFNVDIMGKKVSTYLCVYLLGYYFFSRQSFALSLKRCKIPLVMLALAANIANTAIFIFIGGHKDLNTICNYASFALAVPALMILAHDHLDFANSFTRFNSSVSYVFYILHFPIVILCQYLLSHTGVGVIPNFTVTVFICYPLVYALCVGVRKVPYLQVLFGLSAKKK